MKIDKSILELQERLELELENADPEHKGCFGTIVYNAKDSVCLNCTSYDQCAVESKKNRSSYLLSVEDELSRIDEKYALDKTRNDDDLVAKFDWVSVIVDFAKNKPNTFNEAVDVYMRCIDNNKEIAGTAAHRTFIVNAEKYVEKVIDGLCDQGYIVWDHEHGSKILWKKA